MVDQYKPLAKKVNGEKVNGALPEKVNGGMTRDETSGSGEDEEISKEDVIAFLRKTRVQAQDSAKKTRMAFKTMSDTPPTTRRLKKKV